MTTKVHEIMDGKQPAPRAMVTRGYDTPGLPPAGQVPPHGGMARTEFFGGLKIPMVNGMPKGAK